MSDFSKRIESIDILRGLDLFFLLFLQPVVLSIPNTFNSSWFNTLLYQLDHEKWIGFRCWDLVMPLFLFLVGASMPFSFSKYYGRRTGMSKLYGRICRRVILLFVLGMIVQGNLLGFLIDNLEIYNNTLQAIAVGYLIAAVVLLNFGFKTQILITFLLMLVYSIPMAIYGVYEPGDSFAFKIDELILCDFRGDLTYTWIWSSLTFGATVMFGAISGHIIQKYRSSGGLKIIVTLCSSGIALIVLGMIAGNYEPIIKRIWTSSMTMFSVGICMILLGLFYWWIDVLRFSYGLRWLKFYGTNAITAYCLGEVIDFRSIVNSLTYGLRHIVPDWYPFILTLGNAVILFLILYLLYRSRILIKV